ncbi:MULTISPECIES: hypothetical protein [Planktothrix]|uniref:hypothetical protein n=1 Tax=Planktothrix TaxID=54304 RepID=UPI00041A6299|nr:MULTISPECIES: hypothetical protein [Planktothrix]
MLQLTELETRFLSVFAIAFGAGLAFGGDLIEIVSNPPLRYRKISVILKPGNNIINCCDYD